MTLPTLALSLALFTFQGTETLPRLVPGETIEATITEPVAEVHTSILDANYGTAPTVGVAYRIVVDRSGPYHIDLRSYDFDAYLVLSDAQGESLAEDDDGLISMHSRIVTDLEQGVDYVLTACALHGARGRFSLEVVPGAPPSASPTEMARLELEDARANLAHAESRSGVGHLSTARPMTDLARLLETRGDHRQAQQLLERVLQIHESELGPAHRWTASSLNNLAFSLQSTGDYQQALPLLVRAVEIFESEYGPDHPSTARGLSNLAGLFTAMGDYESAMPLLERALAIHEAALGPSHPSTANSLDNLAVSRRDSGDLPAAKSLHQRALAIREARLPPDHLDIAQSLSSLATVMELMGEYAVARPLAERALAIREARLPLGHPLIAESVNVLARVLAAMGDRERAKTLFEQALSIRELQLGPDHPWIARILNDLAFLLFSMGDAGQAKSLYERALRIDEAALDPDHPSIAMDLGNLAGVLVSVGNFEQAKPLLERSLAIDEDRLGPDHPGTARGLNNMGDLLESLGEFEQARPYLERSLAICEVQLGRSHSDTTQILNSLAIMLLDMRDVTAAWELVRRGQGGTASALARILALRTPEESRQYLSMKRWQLEVLLSLPRIRRDPDIERFAASSLLAWKGQVGRVARDVRRLAHQSAEAREVSEGLHARQAELSRLAYDTEMKPEARAGRLEVVRREITAQEVLLRDLLGIEDHEALDVEALCDHLPANAALVSFFAHRIREPARYVDDEVVEPGRWTEPHLVAWIARPESEVISVDLGLADAMEQRTKGFLDGVSRQGGYASLGPRGQSVGRAGPGAGTLLRQSLWDPLVEHLGDASLVIISHDRFTATLPFEVLMEEDGRYLIEDRSFVYLHDLQSLGSFDQEPSRDHDSLFCVGGVDFDERGEPASPAAGTMRGVVDAPMERWQSWGPLESTRSEATTIRDLHREFVPDGRRVLVTGAGATEERVLAEMPHASIVHLATHGYFRPEGLTGALPDLLSGLVFAGANLRPEHGRLDGYLTAADVDWTDLSGVELVTLSACETGLGRSESGEGMSGFRTTLLRAGARTVISSLWQVPDDSTATLMSRFYENLLQERMGKLEALREAQLWMLRENRRVHGGNGRPHSWGAFVLSGDWR